MGDGMHLDDQGRVVLDTDRPDPVTRARAVVACGLCDADGYRGTVVCDHVDHSDAAVRGSALCRQALAKAVGHTDTADGALGRERRAERLGTMPGSES